MEKPRVFATRIIDQSAVNKLKEVSTLTVWPEDYPPSHESLIRMVSDSDGLLTMLSDSIDKEVIRAGSNRLKVISQMAVGFDNIDVRTATKAGIAIGNTPGVLTNATADHAWALLMAAARRVVEADREVHEGIWKPWGPAVLCGTEVHGATLGIIGFGRIGQAVARRAAGFDMKVQYYSRHEIENSDNHTPGKLVTLEALLSTSDFISLHVNLTPETFHLIGKNQFRMMKPGVILVNTSRGSVIDTEALRSALLEGFVAAAGLDVYDPEPIKQDDPILKMKNVVITPHIASATTQTRQKMAMIAVENLIAGLEGRKLPYCVNPEVYK